MTAPGVGSRAIRILLVEDDENDALLLARRLEREGLAPDIERVFTARAMRGALGRGPFDVVLSDFSMPGFDALQALRVLHESGRDIPFIVVSGTIGEQIAVAAMRAGAHDYFSKQNLDRLASAIDREVREARVRRERREALEGQRVSEERLRLVLDSVKDHAIYTLDGDGRVTGWHRGAGLVYGYSEAEAMGQPFGRFFPDDAAATRKADEILATVRARGGYQGELFQVCRDGSIFWAEATLARLQDDADRLRGISVVIRDITTQMKLLEDLRVAIRSRDEFLSMASHELRTPVTTLQLQLQALHRQLDRASEGVPRVVRDRVGVLEGQVTRIALLVSALLDLSRMRLGTLELRCSEADLTELGHDTVERLRAQAERAGCALSLRASAPVPGYWDPLRIEQVLTNLLTNAIKFGASRPIVVSVSGDEDRAWVAVEDQGIGIAPENQVRVFDRLERAAPAENYGGLGLGLYIARQIVEAHGGTIGVRSVPGAGATFVVELPRRADQAKLRSGIGPPGGPPPADHVEA